MSGTVFTHPGKLGDALHAWPVVHHWQKQTGQDCELWLDETTCKPLVPLLKAQPGVTDVKLIGGITNYNCGGQPWHFGLPTSAHEGKVIYHLGLRSFPVRQLTLECLQTARVPVSVSPEVLASEVCLRVTEEPSRNRLVLHGQPVYAHTRTVPTFWRFLADIRSELETLFDDIVFVGTERDLEVAARTYPGWQTYDDGGDFLKLANLIAASKAMIGVGSAPIVLAGLLQIPGIRVHDPIGDHPKAIWSNIASNNLNETEASLRSMWPAWRDRYLVDAGQAVT